jgi:hypothetical protein
MYIGINTDHKAHVIKQNQGKKKVVKNKKNKQDMMCRRLIAIITSLV